MTLQALLTSGPFIIDLIIVGTFIIGTAATIFGLYDRFHLHWTGDLKIMITSLLTSSIILVVCTVLKNGSAVSNAMLFTYTFLIVSIYFATQLKNPKLTHEPRKQQTIKEILRRR